MKNIPHIRPWITLLKEALDGKREFVIPLYVLFIYNVYPVNVFLIKCLCKSSNF